MKHTDETGDSIHYHYNMLHCFCREREKMTDFVDQSGNTSGQWDFDEGDLSIYAMTDSDIVPLFQIHEEGGDGITTEAERRANARLIAASKDLLTALSDMVGRFGRNAQAIDWDAIDLAKAAIEKATR